MEIHNVSEDKVYHSIEKIFAVIKKDGNPDKFCLCEQCMLDTVCFALNRIEPRYVVSHRGIARLDQDWVRQQQTDADIASLVYKGLKQVNHNQRPHATHNESVKTGETETGPAFHIPTIVGRLFDGETFAPLDGVTVELRGNGGLVPMRNPNWQNPFTLVANTPGTYTFWPAPISAGEVNENSTFEYLLKFESPEYETLTHFFKIPTISSVKGAYSFSPDKTFKLPDLYLFHPGEAEKNG